MQLPQLERSREEISAELDQLIPEAENLWRQTAVVELRRKTLRKRIAKLRAQLSIYSIAPEAAAP